MLFGFLPIGGPEMVALLVLGILLFGRKLPELGRSVGKTLVEFKKGMKGIEDDVNESAQPRASIEPEPVRAPQRVTPSAKPNFDDAPATTAVPPKV
ncbi:MAG TPA: twin-arginine translocase TatA/TatE family subunit [Gemmataceae bacterium]|jgi:sec-independent protein translocase protein TatA